MSLCVLCGVTLCGDADLCAYHLRAYAESWAATNRIICDFVHRGIDPMRVSAAERELDAMRDAVEVM
jgi:hypothetical protein